LLSPPAEHPTDLVQFLGKGDVFFRVERLYFPRDLKQEFQGIKPADGLGESVQPCGFSDQTRSQKLLDNFKKERVNFLP